jgi:hypothetical protein
MSLCDDYLKLADAVNEIAVYWPTRVEPKLTTFDLTKVHDLLHLLEKAEVASPRTFSHGPTNVVLVWENKGNHLYFTCGKDRVSVLTSSPEMILDRFSYSYDYFDEDLIKKIWKDFQYAK